MTIKTKVFFSFRLGDSPQQIPLWQELNMQFEIILFHGILKKIAPNKLASYVIITLLADVTLS